MVTELRSARPAEPAGLGRASSSQAALAAAEVALELGRDRVAAGLGQLGGVLLLLQRGDVLGDLGVLGGQLVDAALPGPGQLRQLAEVERHVEQLLQLGQQGQRRLRARRVGHVVRHRPPTDISTSMPARASGVGEHADDAGRALVGGRRQPELPHQVPVAGRGTETGIGRVCGVSASSAPSRCTRVTLAERRAEAIRVLNWRQRRLGSMPSDQHQVPAAGQLGQLELGGRPGDLALVVGVQLDLRPVDLEVVEVVGVEGEDQLGLVRLGEVLDRAGRRVAGVVPAAEGRHDHRVDQITQIAADLHH